MKQKLNYEGRSRDGQTRRLIIKSAIQLENKRLDSGFLGKFWGTSSSIPNNIAAVLIVLLILAGICYTFLVIGSPNNKIPIAVKDFWSIITPPITLAIGYLFGKGAR